MKTFTIAVESQGYSADWVDNLIVIADSEAEAKELGEQFIRDGHPFREVTHSEAYTLEGEGRVVGRLILPAEE